MAVYEQTYEPWNGVREPRWRRVLAIFGSGVALPFHNAWVLLLIVLSYFMVIGWAFFLYMLSSVKAPPIFAVGNNLYRDFLSHWWTALFVTLLAAIVDGPLISRDIKYNAVSMYFSKAITRMDYVGGKFLIALFFLLLGTLAPALTLLAFQAAFGQETLRAREYVNDASAIFAHSLTIAIPTSAIVLAISSISRSTYAPGLVWFGLFYGSHLTSEIFKNLIQEDWCRLVSLMTNINHLGNLFFEYRPARVAGPLGVQWTRWERVLPYDAGPSLMILGGLSVVSLLIVIARLRVFESQE